MKDKSVYQVSKPHISSRYSLKSVALRLVFPPLLIWDLSTLTGNALAGKAMGKKVLNSQTIDFSDDELIHAASDLPTNKPMLSYKKYTVLTHDKAELDTLLIEHQKQAARAPADQKYIILFVGNDISYAKKFFALQTVAETTQVNIIAFDYRGVGLSTGCQKSRKSILTDGIAQVQCLIQHQVHPNNIFLWGHSLGGNVATNVALYFYKEHTQSLNLFSDRSCSSLTNVLVGTIRTRNDGDDSNETLRGKFLGALAKPLVKTVLLGTKWEINAGACYEKLPNSRKNYITAEKDPYIPAYASIHRAMHPERKKDKACIIKYRKELKGMLAEPDLSRRRHIQLQQGLNFLAQREEDLKNHKMQKTAYAPTDAHVADLNHLETPSGITGLSVFKKFIDNAVVKVDPDIVDLPFF